MMPPGYLACRIFYICKPFCKVLKGIHCEPEYFQLCIFLFTYPNAVLSAMVPIVLALNTLSRPNSSSVYLWAPALGNRQRNSNQYLAPYRLRNQRKIANGMS